MNQSLIYDFFGPTNSEPGGWAILCSSSTTHLHPRRDDFQHLHLCGPRKVKDLAGKSFYQIDAFEKELKSKDISVIAWTLPHFTEKYASTHDIFASPISSQYCVRE